MSVIHRFLSYMRVFEQAGSDRQHCKVRSGKALLVALHLETG